MRTALLAALVAVLPPVPRAADPTRPASERLRKLTAVYVDGLFRAKPHLASYLGERKYDRLVQDLSSTAIARRVAELATQQEALSRIERDRLSPDEKTDAAILADGIALELVEMRDIREWTWNPRLVDDFTHYDPREVVAARLGDLVHGEWPEKDRLAAAAAQLRALPRYLAQRRAAFGAVSRVHLDQAVKDNAGRIEFFETELAQFTRRDPAADKARVAALEALRGHGERREDRRPPRLHRGEEAHRPAAGRLAPGGAGSAYSSSPRTPRRTSTRSSGVAWGRSPQRSPGPSGSLR